MDGREAVPRWLDDVVAQGLARDPRARHRDLAAAVAALDPGPRRARRAIAWGAAVTVLAATGLLRAGGCSPRRRRARRAAAPARRSISAGRTRAQTIRAAVTAARPQLAEGALAIAEPGFAAWAAGWRDAAIEACQGTERGEQSQQRLDARGDCLRRARARFEAAVSLFERADADAVVRADELVTRLPDVALCARPDAALAVDAVAPRARSPTVS
ncbi:MAG: hypothetical protein U0168_24390 [Nannocystaceae bacterium]